MPVFINTFTNSYFLSLKDSWNLSWISLGIEMKMHLLYSWDYIFTIINSGNKPTNLTVEEQFNKWYCIDRTKMMHAFSKENVCVCVCVCTCMFSNIHLCGSMDCSPPRSSVHGTFQNRLLEWVVICSSRRSLWPRVWTHV